MKKIALFASLLLLRGCAPMLAPTAFAQTTQPPASGQVYVASQFSGWLLYVNQGNASTGASSIFTAPYNSQGQNLPSFVVGLPLSLDKALSTAETVTITGVESCNASVSACVAALSCYSGSQICKVSATFANLHTQYATIQSGTFGLQEAINYAALQQGGTVLVDQTWGGTTAMITSATGTTAVVVQDNRSGAPIFYKWGGSAYAVVTSGSGTVNSGTGACLAWYQATGSALNSDCNIQDTGSYLQFLLPILVNDGNPYPAVVLGVGGSIGPNLTAAAGVPTGCGSTFPVGSYDANSTGGPGTTGYGCAATAQNVNSGQFNQALLATSNVPGGTFITSATFNNYFTLAASATVNSCSFYLGHYANAAHHIACGITTAPTATTTGTTVLCYAAYTEVNGPINATVALPLTGCGTLTAGNYWEFLTTDDGGYVSAGLTNCGSSCAKASYEGTSTWTFGGTPVISSSALTAQASGYQYVQSLNVTPTGTPFIANAPVGVDINANGQVQGLEGVALTSLGSGPLGLDSAGLPRIMPVADYPLSVSGVFGNSTDFPTGQQVVAVTPINAGIITGLNIVTTSLNGGSCTTAPTFNVFTASTSNVGTAQIASATQQTVVGTITHVAENLQFGAGQVIGVYVSVQGATCLAPTFSVTLQYSEN